MEFIAKDGRIYRDPALKKTLVLLNITEVFWGRIPDFFSQGMSYEKMRFTAKIEHGKVVFNKIYLDCQARKLTGQGTLDPLKKSHRRARRVRREIKKVNNHHYLCVLGELCGELKKIRGK